MALRRAHASAMSIEIAYNGLPIMLTHNLNFILPKLN